MSSEAAKKSVDEMTLGDISRLSKGLGVSDRPLSEQIAAIARSRSGKDKRTLLKHVSTVKKQAAKLAKQAAMLFGGITAEEARILTNSKIESLSIFIHGVAAFVRRFLSSSPPPGDSEHKRFTFGIAQKQKAPDATNTRGSFDLSNVIRRRPGLVASYTLANPISRILPCKFAPPSMVP
jgi:hypothetical protein